ncbi:MAG: LuxR C-terminal-related transcriptional regulator [Anaerolineae bacterium]|nr:LuxR C-terminal-related transcriptional regulator [Anaerolineae bacterium]
MTRLIFLPEDDTSILLYDSRLSLDELLQNIHLTGEENLQNKLTVLQQGQWTLAATGGHPRLSQRQSDVLKGLAEGLTTRQIAHRLDISTRMVTFHISSLKVRLNAQTRAEIILQARENRLL